MEVESAIGQSVPSLGYVEVTLTFPKDFVGVDIEVPTLALIVPDFSPNSQPSVLVGTNMLDQLYKDFSALQTCYFSPSFGYKQVLKVSQLRQEQSTEGNVGLVCMPSKQPQMIPVDQSTVICSTATVREPHKWVIAEHHSVSPLPGGLIIKTCVVALGEKFRCHLPVVN